MSETVIQVDNLWKKYRLGELGTGTLRHDFNRWWHRVRGKEDPYSKLGEAQKSANGNSTASSAPTFGPQSPTSTSLQDDEMWALRGVSFEVKQGEILGIIGRNGAGKSTLLKILSRVTAPTRGEVRVKGRIASLLEVGTGFHPELTGRDNIFLNGAILGMTKAEVRKKFDEIVGFSGIERFIDTPVKRYSSGMYVRLAFAVAAHLEPEVLIVDEVLAVGDIAFQKRCMGKMQSVARGEGRTVLFVSHNMTAIQMLCSQIAYLLHGEIRGVGDVEEHIDAYMQDVRRQDEPTTRKSIQIGVALELRQLSLSQSCVVTGGELDFELEFFSPSRVCLSDLALLIYSAYGTRVAVLDLRQNGEAYIIDNDSDRIRGRIRSLPLVEGDYHLGIYIKTEDVNENILDLATITVTSLPSQNDTIPYPPMHRGIVELELALLN